MIFAFAYCVSGPKHKNVYNVLFIHEHAPPLSLLRICLPRRSLDQMRHYLSRELLAGCSNGAIVGMYEACTIQ
jgi:hypothetical protein